MYIKHIIYKINTTIQSDLLRILIYIIHFNDLIQILSFVIFEYTQIPFIFEIILEIFRSKGLLWKYKLLFSKEQAPFIGAVKCLANLFSENVDKLKLTFEQ